jgi:hypothetical protein
MSKGMFRTAVEAGVGGGMRWFDADEWPKLLVGGGELIESPAYGFVDLDGF